MTLAVPSRFSGMSPNSRIAPGGLIYHALNRANARVPIFHTGGDYAAFLAIVQDVQAEIPIGIYSYVIMPNHWHFVLEPEDDGVLSAFLGRVSLIHAKRWHGFRETTGSGHLYQDRFRSFPVQDDSYFLTLVRYVEGNALRAGLVRRAEDWQWSSLWQRIHGARGPVLAKWPVPELERDLTWLNEPVPPRFREEIAAAIDRGFPFGENEWRKETAARLNICLDLPRRGRPKKSSQG